MSKIEQEERFEQRLLDNLMEDFSPQESKQKAHSKKWLAVPATGVAAAAFMAVSLISSGTPNVAAPQQETQQTVALTRVEAIVAKTKEAMSSNDWVMHVTNRYEGQPDGQFISESWTDKSVSANYRSKTFDTKGNLLSDSGSLLKDGVVQNRYVDYKKRTFVNKPYEAVPEMALPRVPEGPGVKEVGTETINGMELIHLVEENPTGQNRFGFFEVDGKEVSPSKIDYWISTKSYMVVRVDISAGEGSVTRAVSGFIWDDKGEYEWLPRTDEQIAAFLPEIPEGFKEIPAQ